MRRANLPNQTVMGRDLALKNTGKFMHLYIAQMKALSKYRGHADQKIVIEHMNVASGGQAIVG